MTRQVQPEEGKFVEAVKELKRILAEYRRGYPRDKYMSFLQDENAATIISCCGHICTEVWRLYQALLLSPCKTNGAIQGLSLLLLVWKSLVKKISKR